MRLDRRVQLLDLVMTRAQLRISTARDLADVQAMRRRGQLTEGPLAGVVDRIGAVIFGRPPRDVVTEDRTVPGPAGPIPVRVYRPQGTGADRPLVVNFHGGGFVLGDLDGNDWVCATVAGELGGVVVSVDYRLAPEHRPPAGIDDCIAATAWAVDHAPELGAGGRVAVMGDSAGGTLAALVAIAARDADGPEIDHQVLVYPATDLTMSFPSTRELADAPILKRADMEVFLRLYLGDDADADDPRLSPYHVADLAGLPPALVQTAEHDPLRDEGRAYADRLRVAGVSTRWTQYAGAPHGYISLPGLCRAAPQAVAEIVQELRRHLLPDDDGLSRASGGGRDGAW